MPIPECGYIQTLNVSERAGKGESTREGFQSIGWRFSSDRLFSNKKLSVFITEKGITGYNLIIDSLTTTPLDNGSESRVEVIATDIDYQWEGQLMEYVLF